MSGIHSAEIIGKRHLGGNTFSIQLRSPAIASIAKPGEFVMVRPSDISDGYDPITPRPYSIYALMYENGDPAGFSLIIQILGRGSAAIYDKPIGGKLQCNGPLGSGLEIDPSRHYIMVAGGTGIAPVAFAAQEMEKAGIEYTILYGGRSISNVHLDELAEFDLSAKPATEDGSLGHAGLVTELMQLKLQEQREDNIVFACGPWNMMRAATLVAKEMDVPCLCSLERYMACGFGVCLACIYKKTTDELHHTCCQEGPVVNGAEVNWDA